MENEIKNFIKIWCSVVTSLCYCYALAQAIPKGTKRLICLLPVICLFLYLPLLLSTMVLGGPTAFFLSWLANFKLLLFAFDLGPLSSDPSISVARFVAVACLPIKIQETQQKTYPHMPQNAENSSLKYAIKAMLVATLIHVYNYTDHIYPKIVPFLYCLQVYVSLELVLAIVGGLARVLTGLDLEPQFNKPYLSTSLQDFWGRRWNLMVPSILRPTVYEPIRNLAAGLVGRKWATVPGILGTFLVSGVMHELMFYYLGREKPTLELTSFFLLHGLCLAVEVVLKKVFASRWQMPRLISGCLTMGFMMVTGFWLFLPSLHRCKAFERGSMESEALFRFLQNASQNIKIHVAPASV